MKKYKYLLFSGIVVLAFWQIFFLQNGMKWDFVDAFLPSRYFFSESILNNQFPLWNPYILYGIPVYADLVSVFNPEFWIVGNMFGYSNITLQYIYLAYIFLAGVSFSYFLKQFNTEQKISAGLSVAYMLSGFSIGNAQHLAFVCGYAIIPFVVAAYLKFLDELNRRNLLRLAIALYLMIFCGYPALTIILAYLLMSVFVYFLISRWNNSRYIKKLVVYHFALVILVVLSASVLIVAYFHGASFISRYSGLAQNLSLKHPFTVKSFLSWILPMATATDVEFFETDASMSNSYWGVVSLILFIYTLTGKITTKASFIFLSFGIFSVLASLGDRFFVREFLYDYAPLMDMFQYPSLFRAFSIFCFLAFTGINLNRDAFSSLNRKKLVIISGLFILSISVLILVAISKIEEFAFFERGKSFSEEFTNATLYDSVILQGVLQLLLLSVIIIANKRIKSLRRYSLAVLLLFVFDGIISTQLNIHQTVISKTDPIKFYKYLKSSPKGFPVPPLNPIGENSDKNASTEFTWMNNNVFPKKITFDGSLSFKSDGYRHLSDNYPDLLDAIKQKPVVYLSDDIRDTTKIKNFSPGTVFLPSHDYEKLEDKIQKDEKADKIKIADFSPKKVLIEIEISNPQLLTYQQNYFRGWKAFIDGKEQEIIKSNFAHMSVFVPSGKHTVLFKFSNPILIYAFGFGILVLLVLIGLFIHDSINRHPENKKRVLSGVFILIGFFILFSSLNRYFYQRNKAGLAPEIINKTENWNGKYGENIRIFISANQSELSNLKYADTTAFINENMNISALSHFLMNTDSKYFAFAWQGGIIETDVFELMYSFYPELIEQKSTANSGYILLQENEDFQNYFITQDFEPESTNEWIVDSGRINENSVTGNRSFCYEPDQVWGTSLTLPVKKENQEFKRITVIADVLMKTKTKETLLVISTERDGKMQLYKVADLNQWISETGNWGRIAFGTNLDNVQENDVIKVYFWNKNNAHFCVDNLKVKFN